MDRVANGLKRKAVSRWSGAVSIAHGHFYVVMAEDFLEGKDVSARHHKVCCKRVAQNVGKLPTRKHY